MHSGDPSDSTAPFVCKYTHLEEVVGQVGCARCEKLICVFIATLAQHCTAPFVCKHTHLEVVVGQVGHTRLPLCLWCWLACWLLHPRALRTPNAARPPPPPPCCTPQVLSIAHAHPPSPPCCAPQVLSVAQDQNGCRFLQRKFDEGGAGAVAVVLPEVLDSVVELMVGGAHVT